MDLKVGRIYQLQQKIGSGSFGEIYKAINLKNQEYFAVKLERVDTKQPQLQFESKIYNYLNSDDKILERGIPKIYLTSVEGDYNIMVMDLLGKSLENLFESNAKKFSLKTVLMFGIQALQRIEFLHSKFILHRDLKPDNFIIGRGDKSHIVYLIDFGLSKKYITRENKHIPYKEKKNLTGTARYASVNTHLGIEQSRRDDLESLGYIMIYFLKGVLPWMNQPGANQKEKYDNITKKKASTTEDILCSNLPEEFVSYIKYCKRLKFEEKPDYGLLKRIFKDLLQKQNLEEDFRFDWVQIHDKTVYSQKSAKFQENYLPRIIFQNQSKEKQQQKAINSYIVLQNDQLINQIRNFNDFQNIKRNKSLKQQY